ncbi:MAG: OsmC family protein [Candidatus Atabeyarchaeum deiterrae]
MSEGQQDKKEGKVQESTARIKLEWQNDLAFLVSFDIPTVPSLKADEPPQAGGSGEGPNASRLLGAAIGNCLSASLAFCLKKSKLELKSLNSDVEVKIARNEKGYLRVKQVKVDLHPELKSSEDVKRIERCLGIFQDYCIVTEAVRKGIPVEVNVK